MLEKKKNSKKVYLDARLNLVKIETGNFSNFNV